MELVLVALLLLVAAGTVLIGLRVSALRRRVVAGTSIALAAIAAAVGLGTAWNQEVELEADVQNRPIETSTDGFTTSRACKACHPDQHATWENSYHRTMTQRATPETVLADFDDVELTLDGWTFRLFHRDDELWVDMPELDWADRPDPHGPRVQRQIVMSTGSHHLQLYWYNPGNSRVLALLPFVFNVELDRWTPRFASAIRPPEHGPISGLGRWNKICIECHVTQGRLRPIVAPAGQDTHVAELAIACEACHGPAENHVVANHDPRRRYASHLGDAEDATIVNPEDLPHDRRTEVCGQCHSTSIWTSQEAIDDFMVNGFAYRAGDRLADSKAIVRGKLEWNRPEVQRVLSFQMEFLENTFWSDGMTRVTGREYNGLLETPCFQRGEMSCLSCHSMHREKDDRRPLEAWKDDQLKQGMRGNLACTQCHAEFRQADSLVAHTYHEADSSGSNCYNCHMPHTTYGLLKAIRSHQVDSPSVQASVETGRPNACNQCHLDQTLAWSADHLQQWYGIEAPELTADQRDVSASLLWLLRGHAGQRALAAWTMGWEPALEVSGRDWQAPYLAQLLQDPYVAVRHMAARSLRRAPGFDSLDYDHTEERSELILARERALAQWRRQHRAGTRTGKAILIDSQGNWVEPTVARLLRSRDDRPVFFAE